MPKVTYMSPTGASHEVDVPVGTTVMQGAVKNGIDGIVAECGGVCMCSTCHVYIDENWVGRLPPVEAQEESLLECTVSPRQPNSRLSCQIKMTDALDGLVVHLPKRQR